MRAAGLRFIHQELHAVRGLSVAENMFLDRPYPRRFGLVDWRALNRAAAAALARLGLDRLRPTAPMSELGAGDQMLVRIAGTLVGGDAAAPWLYVMDEPTAGLDPVSANKVLAHAATVREAGGTVLIQGRGDYGPFLPFDPDHSQGIAAVKGGIDTEKVLKAMKEPIALAPIIAAGTVMGIFLAEPTLRFMGF